MEKRNKIIFWIATGLLSAFMLMSASMYFFNYAEMSKSFIALGYPTYLLYPLGVAKLLGVIAITTRKSNTLKEWAYAGFSFNFLMAIAGHIAINDGQFIPAIVALVLVIVSKVFGELAFKKDTK